MSQKEVRAILEMRLKDWADGEDLPVAFENQAFAPPAGSYLKFNLLPALTRSEDLEGQHRAINGIVQITIFSASGSGPKEAEELLIELDSLFPCGQSIAGDTLSVLIASPLSAANGFADKGHYAVPASFQYRADVS